MAYYTNLTYHPRNPNSTSYHVEGHKDRRHETFSDVMVYITTIVPEFGQAPVESMRTLVQADKDGVYQDNEIELIENHKDINHEVYTDYILTIEGSPDTP